MRMRPLRDVAARAVFILVAFEIDPCCRATPRATTLTGFFDNTQAQKAFTWDGEVQTYEPGRVIAVRKLKTQEKKFDLTKRNTTYTIDPGVQTGSKVEVTEQDLGNGKRQVTILLKDK